MNETYQDLEKSGKTILKLTFSEALEHIKNGVPMQRVGWNGEFVFMRPEFNASYDLLKEIKSLDLKVKDFIKSVMVLEEIDSVKFTSYLSMFTNNNTIINGWIPSQTDMFAEDWEIAF